MKLPIDRSGVLDYADLYLENSKDYDDRIACLVPEVKARGYLERAELLELSDWKSTRNRRNIKNNRDSVIEEITRFSLGAQTEEARINCLCCLHGVRLGVASAILHWFHADDYPIYDVRALATVGVEKKEGFEDWMRYVEFCRRTAKEYRIEMRTLDRALWWYSKEHDLGSA